MTNLLAAGPKLRLLARLARLESRSPVTSLLSVVGVVVESGDTMVLTPERQREGSTEKIKRRDKTDRSCSVRKHYQSYYQTQRG